MRKIGLLILLAAMLAPLGLSATRYNIYIHGFANNKQACHGQSTCPDIWTAQKHSYNVRHVSYNGWKDPLVWKSDRGAYKLFYTMYKYCRGGNYCRIFCHSMGCLTTGYVVDKYASRYGLRVIGVSALAAASGGSEYANVGPTVAAMLLGPGITGAITSWMTAVNRLKTSSARGSYDHNDTAGAIFHHTAGYKDLFWPVNGILPGKDDSVVAYHSTCGMRDRAGFSSCGKQSKKYWSTCKKGWFRYPCRKTRTYYQFSGHRTYRTVNENHFLNDNKNNQYPY